jgi:hypothetical protein
LHLFSTWAWLVNKQWRGLTFSLTWKFLSWTQWMEFPNRFRSIKKEFVQHVMDRSASQARLLASALIAGGRELWITGKVLWQFRWLAIAAKEAVSLSIAHVQLAVVKELRGWIIRR